MTKATKNTSENTTVFSKIGTYNIRVHEFLKQTSISPVVQAAIKHFKDNAQLRKLTNNQYNKEVEEFNNAHGFYITKKGTEFESPQKYYSYINYPFLDREALKTTMDNYRKFVYEYNKKAETDNVDIREYNKKTVLKNSELSDIQKKVKKDFYKENKCLFVKDYNDLAESENEREPIIPKRLVQKIKYQSELIFHVLIGFYVGQLKRRNAYLMNINKPTSVFKNDLPKLEIDHRKLATHKIASIPRLDICKKTAQNHVKRLREAGVLINYIKVNQKKPIKVNFNSKILVILDGKSPNSQTPENKQLLGGFKKNLPDNKESFSFCKKGKEIKDYAKSIVENKCGSMLEGNVSSPVFYKSTKEKNNKNTLGAEKIKNLVPDFLKKEVSEAKKYSEKQKNQARNFIYKIEDDQILAEKLFAGHYDDYKGLRYEQLKKIENNPMVDREEFRAVLLQDFVKQWAKIWKNRGVFVGEWKKTINRLNESSLFAQKSSENSIVVLHKATQIEHVKKYRWLLKWANDWFRKSEVSPLFPYKYFDATRKKSNEIGFYGLHSVWKSHLKYQEKRKTEKQTQVLSANKRNNRLNNQKKLAKALKKYEMGSYSDMELYNYVKDNLPHDYLLQLSSLINNNNQNFA
ncbi:hypothetical protein SAMN04489761_3020 [Tenacibaculum sp. MAR_2009_124]|uniref:hypothetical protein n=1 Tax=Tenacibaculum sp. MAR_2009_124 TaxID=1250059 RepID=UPI0008996421|nr:hypothetical protein [Tenacibaculum sp. MAR_2009_124]SEC44821.1 hypothetical protein SAMN04489761_3020 [Tenacibaculum sp. MAR_2009_124]